MSGNRHYVTEQKGENDLPSGGYLFSLYIMLVLSAVVGPWWFLVHQLQLLSVELLPSGIVPAAFGTLQTMQKRQQGRIYLGGSLLL
jgi:hypothetical protein